jgi:drug/metabolite transporter (DMT)-like permease
VKSPFARIAVLAAIWGCSFLFIKVALEGVSAAQVVLARIVFGAGTLTCYVLIRRERLPRRLRTWMHVAIMGLFAGVLPFLGFSWGEEHGASSGLAAIYNGATPLWTLLVAIIALPAERPTRTRLAGLVMGFAGVLLVVAPWRSTHGAHLAGQLACLGAGACYGAGFAWTRRFLTGVGSAPGLAAAQLLCAAAEFGVVAPFVATDRVSLPPRVWLSLVALGALGTGFAYVIYYGLIHDVGATTASTVTYVVPLVAVTLGVIVLGEAVQWNYFAGAAVVISGIAVAEGRLRWRNLPVKARGSSEAPG